MLWDRFHEDIAQAHQRVAAVPSATVETPHGLVEYATEGTGESVLVSHGIWGSHAEAVGLARTYVGPGFRVVAPSRFGYFRSDLPADASPARQADAYVSLLDHLGIERTIAVGFSAGGPSVIQLALRHPDRVSALLLMSSALPPSSGPPAILRPVLAAAARSERLFWSFAHLMPGTLHGLMGVPPDYEPTPEEAAVIEQVGGSIFPVRPRRDGFLFDAFVGNTSVRHAGLEELTVPTMIVHAADDSLAPYAHAEAAAARIPDVSFVSIDTGGHLFLGQEARVRREVATFLSATTAGRSASELSAERVAPAPSR